MTGAASTAATLHEAEKSMADLPEKNQTEPVLVRILPADSPY